MVLGMFASHRVSDPMTAPGLRWGILGAGGIAGHFAAAVRQATASTVVAVGSRDQGRADAFAQAHSIPAAHGTYAALVADPNVEAVYVASPHSEHREHALLALAEGKHVLVEKAFTRNRAEAAEVLSAARSAGLLAAEAMWSRYLPHYDAIARTITAGTLGEVVHVHADHSQLLWPNGPQRLWDPALAGGSLLDLGVYPVAFADLILGGLTDVQVTGTLTPEGVDATAVISARGATGGQAVLTSSMAGAAACTATVVGTQARIELDGRFYQPTTMRLIATNGELLDTFTPEHQFHGFRYEIAEFARTLATGAIETERMPHATTLAVMDVLDQARAQLGVRYPGE